MSNEAIPQPEPSEDPSSLAAESDPFRLEFGASPLAPSPETESAAWCGPLVEEDFLGPGWNSGEESGAKLRDGQPDRGGR